MAWGQPKNAVAPLDLDDAGVTDDLSIDTSSDKYRPSGTNQEKSLPEIASSFKSVQSRSHRCSALQGIGESNRVGLHR